MGEIGVSSLVGIALATAIVVLAAFGAGWWVGSNPNFGQPPPTVDDTTPTQHTVDPPPLPPETTTLRFDWENDTEGWYVQRAPNETLTVEDGRLRSEHPGAKNNLVVIEKAQVVHFEGQCTLSQDAPDDAIVECPHPELNGDLTPDDPVEAGLELNQEANHAEVFIGPRGDDTVAPNEYGREPVTASDLNAQYQWRYEFRITGERVYGKFWQARNPEPERWNVVQRTALDFTGRGDLMLRWEDTDGDDGGDWIGWSDWFAVTVADE